MVPRRSRLTILTLAGAVAWGALHGWLVPATGNDIAEPIPHHAAASQPPAPPSTGAVTTSAASAPDVPASAPLDRLAAQRLRSIPSTRGDAFAVLHWQAPAPVVAPAPAPARVIAPPPPVPTPSAPPVPFVFVGMLEKGTARPQAFLAKGEALLVVAAGDVLDNQTYRIESLSPQEVVMTYLPLNLRQTLRVTGGGQ